MDDNFEISPYQPLESAGEYRPRPVESQLLPTTSVSVTRSTDQPTGQAGRSRVLIFLLILLAIAAGPIVVGRFIYHATYNELKAGYDVATSTLGDLKPRLNDVELASRLVAKKVEPSVVSVYRPAGFGEEGQGSGVIVDHDGYIVTNYHVVQDAPSIQIRLCDGRRTSAELVGQDPETDLAILKIGLPNLIPAEWGDSGKMEVGDLVWALGSPYGLESSLTFGIVSAKARHGGDNLFQEYLQTDAAVNPGNSGGPLVNIEGQVIGINSAIVGRSYQGISFAIPSAMAHAKYDEIRSRGHIERSWLGVWPTEVPEEIRGRLGLDPLHGVLVTEVEPRSPAGRAGFRMGDVILKWNGVDCTDPNTLTQRIASTEVGSTAKALVARLDDTEGESQQIELDVKMERRPQFVRRARGGR